MAGPEKPTTAPGERGEMKESKGEFFKNYPKLADMNGEELAKAVQDFLDREYGVSKYEEEMRAFLQSNSASASPEVSDRLLRDSVARYKTEFDRASAEFYRKAEMKIGDYEEMMERIRGKTDSELKMVTEASQNAAKAKAASPEIGQVSPRVEKEVLGGTWPYRIPIVGPILKNVDIPVLGYPMTNRGYLEHKEFSNTADKLFVKEFIPAMGKQYLNLEWQKAHLTEKDFDQYEDLSEEFQDGMEAYIGYQLEWVLKNSPDADALKANLEGLRDATVERYENFAKKDGMIDLVDLKKLRNEASQCLDMARLLNSGKSEEEIAKDLDALNFIDRERWAKTTDAWTETFVETVKRNGSEQAFIDTSKKVSGKTDEMSFGQAEDIFKDAIEKAANAGVLETLKVAQRFNKEANSRQAEILSFESAPESIRPMVMIERSKLLNRITISKNIDDEAVVGFIGKSREGRDSILGNPIQRQALFQAVRNIQARKEDRAWADKIRRLPKTTQQLTMGNKPEEPTAHDEIARHLALISMAEEAEWVIGNLDQNPNHENEGLKVAFEATGAEKASPKVDYQFRDVNKLHSRRYVSEASRAGFNAKNIGLFALQAWGLSTAVVNAIPYLKMLKEGKVAEAATVLKNPYFLLGAGSVIGVKEYNRNPEMAKYLFENAGGQERILTHRALNAMTDNTLFNKVAQSRVSRTEMSAFITDGDEFEVMESLFKEEPKEGVAKLRAVLNSARKRKGPSVITKEDLKGVVEERFQSQLSESRTGQRERTRFLFYEKFLSNPKVNIRELKENCQKWL